MNHKIFIYAAIILSLFIANNSCNNKSTQAKEKDLIKEIVEKYPDGKPKKVRITNKQTHDFKEIIYYPNGKIYLEGEYTPEHKRKGKWVSYFENGAIKSIAHFKNGLTDGEIKVYKQNGKLFYNGYYKQGLKEGIWKIYNDSGKLGAEVKYALDTIVYQKKYFKP